MSVYTEERVTWDGVEAMRVTFAKPSFHDSNVPVKDIGLYALGCGYCESERDKESTFFPSHWPSARCESGQRPHCTCDAWF